MTEFPDLQKLAEKYGTYAHVPAAIWVKFDQANKQAQEKMRQGLPGKPAPMPKKR